MRYDGSSNPILLSPLNAQARICRRSLGGGFARPQYQLIAVYFLPQTKTVFPTRADVRAAFAENSSAGGALTLFAMRASGRAGMIEAATCGGGGERRPAAAAVAVDVAHASRFLFKIKTSRIPSRSAPEWRIASASGKRWKPLKL